MSKFVVMIITALLLGIEIILFIVGYASDNNIQAYMKFRGATGSNIYYYVGGLHLGCLYSLSNAFYPNFIAHKLLYPNSTRIWWNDVTNIFFPKVENAQNYILPPNFFTRNFIQHQNYTIGNVAGYNPSQFSSTLSTQSPMFISDYFQMNGIQLNQQQLNNITSSGSTRLFTVQDIISMSSPITLKMLSKLPLPNVDNSGECHSEFSYLSRFSLFNKIKTDNNNTGTSAGSGTTSMPSFTTSTTAASTTFQGLSTTTFTISLPNTNYTIPGFVFSSPISPFSMTSSMSSTSVSSSLSAYPITIASSIDSLPNVFEDYLNNNMINITDITNKTFSKLQISNESFKKLSEKEYSLMSNFIRIAPIIGILILICALILAVAVGFSDSIALFTIKLLLEIIAFILLVIPVALIEKNLKNDQNAFQSSNQIFPTVFTIERGIAQGICWAGVVLLAVSMLISIIQVVVMRKK